MMDEKFLHYVWKHSLYNFQNLQTIAGESLTIINPGLHNQNAGPDFLQAKIKINDVILAGNIELHCFSSDYEKHGHQHDAAYKNVILHVVYEHDKSLQSTDFPTLELKGLIPFHIIRNYEDLQKNSSPIPCAANIAVVDDMLWQQAFNRFAVARLERKVNSINEILQQNNNNWQETFYQILAKNFGMKVNAEAFFELAKSLPLNILIKQKYSQEQLEALLLGQAGLLNEIFEDTYAIQLQKEYHFLQHKYNLQPIPTTLWKMARMRPQNFPPLRIAQFANLIFQSSHLFSNVLACESIIELKKLFQVSTSDYWLRHYHLGVESEKSKKRVGEATIENFIINTIVPIVFAYGQMMNKEELTDTAISWLELLKPESNNIIRDWRLLKIKPENAFQSQALIELRNEFCNQKRCLECLVGQHLIKG